MQNPKNKIEVMLCDVPIKDKPLLTLQEATQYYNIGRQVIKYIADIHDCVLIVGNKWLIKREKLETILLQLDSLPVSDIYP